MIKEVIKRNGQQEFFDAKKINGWGKWGAKGFSRYIDWTEIVTKTVSELPEVVTTWEINKKLIDNCLLQRTWAGQLMAGRLFAADIHKEVFGGKEAIHIQKVHQIMYAAGVMVKLDYSDEEYELINSWIDHSRDFNCAHYQLEQGRSKYTIRNAVTGRIYETRQLALMRVAMVVCEPEDPILRMDRLKSVYLDLCEERVSAPTPNHTNMGTGHNGFLSCCLYTCHDDRDSINVNTNISEVMTYMSAGLGNNMHIRSLGDSINNGRVVHQGKLPYFNKEAGIVKSNKQGNRGGSMTQYYSAFDPEVKTIIALKNPRTPINKRNRSIDYAMLLNRFLMYKADREEDVFLFNCYTAPDLYQSLYSKDLKDFVELYEKYEKDESFKKQWMPAREIVLLARAESFETGRFYRALIDTINFHTPHRDTIYSSNLCLEIVQPTYWYDHVTELYSEKFLGYVDFDTYDKSMWLDSNIPVEIEGVQGYVAALELEEGSVFRVKGDEDWHVVKTIRSKRQEPEVSVCALGAIIPTNIHTEDQYREAAYNVLYMVDYCIDNNHYALPHMGLTAKARRNAGVGLMDIAHYMARKKLPYTSKEGMEELHRVAERHMYHLIQASIRLGKERGNAEWIHKTDWPRGWTPQKTYTRLVDTLADFKNQYDWDEVSQQLIDAGGGRFSSLCAYMPGESSSKYSACTNSLMPVRELSILKTDGNNTIRWVAPEADTLGKYYDIAWNMTRIQHYNLYAIFQKWTDQAISADNYAVFKGSDKISSSQLLMEDQYMMDMGVKTEYYTNIHTSDKEKLASVSRRIRREINKEELDTDGPVCTSGGCSI